MSLEIDIHNAVSLAECMIGEMRKGGDDIIVVLDVDCDQDVDHLEAIRSAIESETGFSTRLMQSNIDEMHQAVFLLERK